MASTRACVNGKPVKIGNFYFENESRVSLSGAGIYAYELSVGDISEKKLIGVNDERWKKQLPKPEINKPTDIQKIILLSLISMRSINEEQILDGNND